MLELTKLLNKSSFKRTGATKKQNTVTRENPGQNI